MTPATPRYAHTIPPTAATAAILNNTICISLLSFGFVPLAVIIFYHIHPCNILARFTDFRKYLKKFFGQKLNIGSNQPQMLTTIAQLKNAQPAPTIRAAIMFIPSFTEYFYLLFFLLLAKMNYREACCGAYARADHHC